MPDGGFTLQPVQGNPFASQSSADAGSSTAPGYRLEAVDHDPFAAPAAPASGQESAATYRLEPVDHDPFAAPADSQPPARGNNRTAWRSLPMAAVDHDGDGEQPATDPAAAPATAPHAGQHFVAGGKGGAWVDDTPSASLAQRFEANVGESFRNTLTGQALDAGASGQQERDRGQELLRFAADARKDGSGDDDQVMVPTGGKVGVRRMTVAQAEAEGQSLMATAQQKAGPYAQTVAQRAADDQKIEPWSSEPSFAGKAVAGATALAGQLVGGSASPEMLAGTVAARPLQVGEAALPWLARETGVAAGTNAAIGATTDTSAQLGRIQRGEQQNFCRARLPAARRHLA